MISDISLTRCFKDSSISVSAFSMCTLLESWRSVFSVLARVEVLSLLRLLA